jgi:hypothetical protein
MTPIAVLLLELRVASCSMGAVLLLRAALKEDSKNDKVDNSFADAGR